ncbi:hypothetical protein SEA_ALEEMILY_153 [Gordonia phage Aleemily]|uniref:Uncharacterized protein n=1 Tax=Gordonia phage Aleemily TaxID=2965181 RepID=A0A9E7QC32_9CAUD|nr:hypothetical protein SEA_ALEEMILY_153 [Gordonia phage Aleemily]
MRFRTALAKARAGGRLASMARSARGRGVRTGTIHWGDRAEEAAGVEVATFTYDADQGYGGYGGKYAVVEQPKAGDWLVIREAATPDGMTILVVKIVGVGADTLLVEEAGGKSSTCGIDDALWAIRPTR